MFFLLVFFSLNTPPGTKVKLLGTVQVKNGFVLLDDSNISVLGGEVDHMVEKWELQRVSVVPAFTGKTILITYHLNLSPFF